MIAAGVAAPPVCKPRQRIAPRRLAVERLLLQRSNVRSRHTATLSKFPIVHCSNRGSLRSESPAS